MSFYFKCLISNDIRSFKCVFSNIRKSNSIEEELHILKPLNIVYQKNAFSYFNFFLMSWGGIKNSVLGRNSGGLAPCALILPSLSPLFNLYSQPSPVGFSSFKGGRNTETITTSFCNPSCDWGLNKGGRLITHDYPCRKFYGNYCGYALFAAAVVLNS